MYSSEFQESLKAVEAAREENIKYEPTRMTAKKRTTSLRHIIPIIKRTNFPS